MNRPELVIVLGQDTCTIARNIRDLLNGPRALTSSGPVATTTTGNRVSPTRPSPGGGGAPARPAAAAGSLGSGITFEGVVGLFNDLARQIERATSAAAEILRAWSPPPREALEALQQEFARLGLAEGRRRQAVRDRSRTAIAEAARRARAISPSAPTAPPRVRPDLRRRGRRERRRRPAAPGLLREPLSGRGPAGRRCAPAAPRKTGDLRAGERTCSRSSFT